MKKTIVIVILVVYIASIAVVNFFGLQIKQFDHVEYVQEIKCESITVLNENPVTVSPYPRPVKEGEKPINEFYFTFIEGNYTSDPASLASNPNRVRLNYEVLPHLAENTKVTFVFDEQYDKNGNLLVQFDKETETFVFLQSYVLVEVTIKSTDGSNIKTTVKLMGM